MTFLKSDAVLSNTQSPANAPDDAAGTSAVLPDAFFLFQYNNK